MLDGCLYARGINENILDRISAGRWFAGREEALMRSARAEAARVIVS